VNVKQEDVVHVERYMSTKREQSDTVCVCERKREILIYSVDINLPIYRLISPLRCLEIVQFFSQGLYTLNMQLLEKTLTLFLLLQFTFHLIQDFGCLCSAGR